MLEKNPVLGSNTGTRVAREDKVEGAVIAVDLVGVAAVLVAVEGVEVVLLLLLIFTST